MTGVFLSVLDRSYCALWLILAIMVLRPLLRMLPKWGAVALWGMAGLRLLIPISLESKLSLIPYEVSSQTVISDAIPVMEEAASQYVAEPNIMSVLSLVWLVGVLVMVMYFLISYGCLLRKLDTAVRFQENIYQSEHIPAPMVVGLLKPRIYIPFRLADAALGPIIAHEQAHIRRGDHLWKLLAYLVLSIHWFNPFVWFAYFLVGRDVEMACDEAVIRKLDCNGQASYMQALVTFSNGGRSRFSSALGFGEVGVKSRVRALAKYRKPTILCHLLMWVFIVTLAYCFLTTPATAVEELGSNISIHEALPQESESNARPSKDLTGIDLRDEPIRREIESIEEMLQQMHEELAEYPKQYENLDKKYWLALKSSIDFYQEVIPQLEARLQRLKDQIGMK